MKWRIYYGDGSTWNGSPWDAPTTGVQLIVRTDQFNGRYLLAQKDYYYYDPEADDWYGSDRGGFYAYLMRPGPKRVAFGEWVPTEVYQSCVERALADPDFPPKTAIDPGEGF